MHQIFTNLLTERLNRFIRDFEDGSKALYYSEDEDKLIHPGEFGSFREALFRELLRELIPEIYGVSHGFIISSNGQTSKQCDVVVYHKHYSPIIRNPEHQRFFPIESVVLVGEIKSDLSLYDLKKTINNLSTIKSFRHSIKNPAISFQRPPRGNSYDPLLCERDQIATFLYCSKVNFSQNVLLEEINKWDSHPSIRLNFVCSNTGLLTAYRSEICIEPYPTQPEAPNMPLKPVFAYNRERPVSSLIFFINYLIMLIQTTTVLDPEINDYIDLHKELNWEDN